MKLLLLAQSRVNVWLRLFAKLVTPPWVGDETGVPLGDVVAWPVLKSIVPVSITLPRLWAEVLLFITNKSLTKLIWLPDIVISTIDCGEPWLKLTPFSWYSDTNHVLTPSTHSEEKGVEVCAWTGRATLLTTGAIHRDGIITIPAAPTLVNNFRLEASLLFIFVCSTSLYIYGDNVKLWNCINRFEKPFWGLFGGLLVLEPEAYTDSTMSFWNQFSLEQISLWN